MRRTKQVLVGGVPIGGGAPVAIQSMLSVPAHDIDGNLRQAAALEAAAAGLSERLFRTGRQCLLSPLSRNIRDAGGGRHPL